MNKPLSFFLAALLCCGPAAAQESTSATVPESGFYFGFDLGTIEMANREEEIADLIGEEANATVKAKQAAGTMLARLYGGHVINRFVAAELGLVFTGPLDVYVSGTAAPVPPATTGSSFSENASLLFYGLDASVVLRPYPYPSRPFPYKLLSGITLRLGGHYMMTNSSISDYPLGTANGGGMVSGINYDWALGSGLFRVGYTRWDDMAGVAGNDGTSLSLGYIWQF